MNKYYTADLHFGHKLTTDMRGFSSIEEHDETLIANWNAVVKPRDIIYVAGDFAWNKTALNNIKGRLNGDKRLILGNHDLYATDAYTSIFTKLYGALPIGGSIVTHVPVHPSNLGDRFHYNIHGHTHQNVVCNENSQGLDPDKRYICVSTDQTDYTPISFDEIEGVKEYRRIHYGTY